MTDIFVQMDRRQSASSRSTLHDSPTEKHDPLLGRMQNEDIEDLHRRNMGVKGEGYDLESQSTSMGKILTRADTAAWVTKHPSRIPDEGAFLSWNIG